MSIRKVSLLGSISIFLTSLALAGSIPNWPAPATWPPPKASHGLTTLGDISNPLPFIGVTPCRQYDSRSVAPLSDNANLAVALTGGPCGLPATAQAVSVNITVFDITGAGGNGVFRVGTATDPTTAWINYPPTETQRGNAGIVPVNGSGQIVVKVNQGGGSVDFTIDINGYYGSSPGTSTDYFKVSNSGPYAIYGQTSSSATDAAGVYGLASSSTGTSLKGVWGDSSGTNGAIGVFGRATSTTGYNFGVWGSTYSTTAATVGVVGEALGTTTGILLGVEGFTASTSNGAAGVYGVDASGDPGISSMAGSAGVRAASITGYGVHAASEFIGVKGAFMNTAGLITTAGYLGRDATYGVFSLGDFGGTGAKYFVEPHPSDASKVIRYVSLEGPESGTYFRGTARTIDGEAVIEVPESFRIVTDEEGLTVQVSAVGPLVMISVESEDLNQIVVRSSKDVTFHYLVQGVRRAFKDHRAISEGREFMPESATERMPLSLTEEARRRLIANGTYNPDGTVNMDTAERLGWTKMWAEREERARAAAAASAAKRAAMMDEKK